MGIYWLASYPKSGNTWLRAFLTNYRSDVAGPADINDLDGGWTATSRETFDEVVGIESSSLTATQINYYRPLIYERMALESHEPLFFKIHDAYGRNSEGRPIFPTTATAGVIYLVRNPMDVAVSYAHHQSKPVEEVIAEMNNDDAMLAGSAQLPQRLSSWSAHVRSWVDESGLGVQVVRYEDMLLRPYEIFADIVRSFRLGFDEHRVRKAMEFSSFEVLRAQEAAHGFREKQPAAKSFFREGRSGSWRDSLPTAQVQRLVSDHRGMMLRFGYLSSENELLV